MYWVRYPSVLEAEASSLSALAPPADSAFLLLS